MIRKLQSTLPFVLLCLFLTPNLYSQNLLNTSSWTVGSGSVTGFTANGTSAENQRELGLNHIGEEVILWKAVPDNSNNADGGWNSSYLTIDNTKSYRLSVWIKKTNSNNGTTYFGCQKWQSDESIYFYTVLNLDNSVSTNPYFWLGDLPHLDRWYLLVGYIHENPSSSTINLGKIYDGVTGEAIIDIKDFKFTTSTSKLKHRAYLHYDTNTSDRQYFYAPRVEEVNGFEWTLDKLLSINPDSKLLFAYDNAGSQKQRFYCPFANCSVPTPPAGKVAPEDVEDPKNIVTKETREPSSEEDTPLLEKEIFIYPNPTKGMASIKFNSNSGVSLSDNIYVYNSAGILVRTIPCQSKNEKELDLTNLPSGMYLIHIHLSNGTSVTKQIIKN